MGYLWGWFCRREGSFCKIRLGRGVGFREFGDRGIFFF